MLPELETRGGEGEKREVLALGHLIEELQEEGLRALLLGRGIGRRFEMGSSHGSHDVNGKLDSYDNLNVQIPETAHQISQDSWLQVGLVLTSGVNSAFALGYSGTVMVPLGWVGGVVGLLLSAAISLYASILVAELHEHGGKRHIRYRDLAGYIYGPKAYKITWGLQYLNLFMVNVGFVIVAGQAAKAAYQLFWNDHVMKLPHFIAVVGLLCAVFAISIPHLSALRVWLGVSMVLSLVYIVVATALAIKDGSKAPPRDYSMSEEGASKMFTIIGASASIFFPWNTGMIPEIQATIREPVVKNMLKSLWFQFTIGVVPMLAVAFAGYWAYGNEATAYLLNNTNGPVWVKALANIAAVLQTVVSVHIFASPTYEYLDTKFGISGDAMVVRNLSFRFGVRGGYLGITTFFAALLPFLGDFMSLTGAISIIPLTFILANHMYLIARKDEMSSLQQGWHWFNVIIFTLISLAAAVSALRLIAVDSKTYHIFADI